MCNFAAIASPLTCLLKKDVPFIWKDAQCHAFESLKHALIHTPILAFSDYTLPFTLCTNASPLGVGAVLMQYSEGQRPHASRSLNSAESMYSVTYMEALAVVWALEHFKDMIYVYHVTVYTDHFTLQLRNFLVGKISMDTKPDGTLPCKSLCLLSNIFQVVDAFSRNIPVPAVTQIPNFSLYELLVAQRQDTSWSHIVYGLESGDDSLLPKLGVPSSDSS